MGKKADLAEARKDCYEKEPIFDNEQIQEYAFLEQKERDHDYDEYNDETAGRIRYALMKYVEQGAYPLCEFLDCNSTELFTQYLLSR